LATFAFRATGFGTCNLTATGILMVCPFFAGVDVGLVFDLVCGSGNNFAWAVVDADVVAGLGLDIGVGARDFGFTGVGGTTSSSSSSSFIFGISFIVFAAATAVAPEVAPAVA
jgi:hypothetical protein